jgi:hypothetical protein
MGRRGIRAMLPSWSQRGLAFGHECSRADIQQREDAGGGGGGAQGGTEMVL